MITRETDFVVGELYSNKTICHSLQVGNAGGIRPSVRDDGSVRRLVLLTAIPGAKIIGENPYYDRIEDDVLIYTGKGLRGDQEPGGLNNRLVEQLAAQFPVWCFQQVFSRRNKDSGENRWKFLGLLTLLRFHREQLDLAGELRSVWLFEFAMSSEPKVIGIEHENLIAAELFAKWRRDKAIDVSETVVESPSTETLDDVAVECLRSGLLALHPRDFEFIVKRAFDASGYKEVGVTRYSQDFGIDVVASFGQGGWPVTEWQIQVQAKRWLHTVGRKEVAELRGSLSHRGLGCLITTSHFSKAALGEANEAGKPPITLLNGKEFAGLLIALGINTLPTSTC